MTVNMLALKDIAFITWKYAKCMHHFSHDFHFLYISRPLT